MPKLLLLDDVALVLYGWPRDTANYRCRKPGFREDLFRAVFEQGHLVLSYNGYAYVYPEAEPAE